MVSSGGGVVMAHIRLDAEDDVGASPALDDVVPTPGADDVPAGCASDTIVRVRPRDRARRFRSATTGATAAETPITAVKTSIDGRAAFEREAGSGRVTSLYSRQHAPRSFGWKGERLGGREP